jgi:hypothetical protein
LAEYGGNMNSRSFRGLKRAAIKDGGGANAPPPSDLLILSSTGYR